MATLVKTDLGKWKAVIRKTGWPTASKTFRTKRDAEDWARRTEDDMVRGACIQRASADRMTVEDALKRYLAEVTPTKRPTSQNSDNKRSKILVEHLGKYSLAALTPEIIAKFREARLAGEDRKDAKGNPPARSRCASILQPTPQRPALARCTAMTGTASATSTAILLGSSSHACASRADPCASRLLLSKGNLSLGGKATKLRFMVGSRRSIRQRPLATTH